MDRRSFLRDLALTAGGVFVSTKTIFLPPKGGWHGFGVSVMERADVIYAQAETTLHYRTMLDTLVNPDLIAKAWVDDYQRLTAFRKYIGDQ